MNQTIRHLAVALATALAIVGSAAAGGAAEKAASPSGERFEVTSIKAVRPTLVNTIADIQQRNHALAKEAFAAYDSAWNGIETYVNVRSRPMYQELEHGFQARISKALDGPNPDMTAVLAEAQAMLVKFDELVDMVAKAPPLNPLFDDVARLRIVRAHLREVNPALKAGNVEKARKSYTAFDENWDSIEDLIKARSADAYVEIEKGMLEIEQAIAEDKPDADKVTALVNGIMAKYNAIVAEIAKDARSRK